MIKYKDHLEKLVEERTNELAEKNLELEQTNIRLQDVDRLKSVFLASMSHELRTPLNSIIGFTGIMLQGLAGPMNDEQKKQLTMVKGSAGHLLELINDILDISKIEAGKVDLTLEEFKFNDVVKEVAESFTPAARDKELALVTEIPNDIMLFTDRRRTKQVLLNLISNAIKFTDKGSVRVAVKVTDSMLECSVIDTGKGIAAEDITKLFQPFQQVDASLIKKFQGTGLGLYLCKKLLEALGGSIWVKSEPDRGSTFTFTLPLQQQGEIAEMKKVLVIDDNEVNMYLLRFILKQNGYEVVEANTGIMGIEQFSKEKPDLVLMDIQLPDINGLEATRRIKALKEYNGIPIIALTSYAMAGDRQMALDAGCTGYIAKPINTETFISELRNTLGSWPKIYGR